MRHFFPSRVQGALHTEEAQKASQSAGVALIGLECTCARQRRICAPARDVDASGGMYFSAFSFQADRLFPVRIRLMGFVPAIWG
jgi:hypothetical protein